MYGFLITIPEVNLVGLFILVVLVSLRGMCLLLLLGAILIILNSHIRNPLLKLGETMV